MKVFILFTLLIIFAVAIASRYFFLLWITGIKAKDLQQCGIGLFSNE